MASPDNFSLASQGMKGAKHLIQGHEGHRITRHGGREEDYSTSKHNNNTTWYRYSYRLSLQPELVRTPQS